MGTLVKKCSHALRISNRVTRNYSMNIFRYEQLLFILRSAYEPSVFSRVRIDRLVLMHRISAHTSVSTLFLFLRE